MKKDSTPLIQQIREYIKTSLTLLKYEAIDQSSAIIAEVVIDIVIAILILLAFIFLTVTLALFTGHLLGSAWEGFGCVSLLYVLIIFLAGGLKKVIQDKLISSFIKKLFKDRKNK